MPPRLPYRSALVAVCLLLLLSTALAGNTVVLSKRGVSGRTYVWQSGSC